MDIDDERMKKFLDNIEERINWSKENGCKLLDCKTIDSNIELRRENIKLRNENKDLKDKLEIQENLTETYKKIAEKLAYKLVYLPFDDGIFYCTTEAVIDWARNEVEKDV